MFDTPLFTPAIATDIFDGMYGAISSNFAGVAILLGAVAGIGILVSLVNGARKGKLKTGVK